jgi:hypothetical protein
MSVQEVGVVELDANQYVGLRIVQHWLASDSLG